VSPLPDRETANGTIEPRAVLAGATTAFICVGMGLLAALTLRGWLDWTRASTTLVATLFAIVGFVLGGFRAGLGCPPAPLSNGGVAAMLAYIPLGVVQRVVAGRAINPLGLIMAAFFAACFGMFGGYVSNNANKARARK
jgi:hypothetical protein